MRPAALAACTSDHVYVYDFAPTPSAGAAVAAAAAPTRPAAALQIACTGHLAWHPSMPLLYVGALEQGRAGVKVVKVLAALAAADMGKRARDVAALGGMVRGGTGTGGMAGPGDADY